MRYLIAEDEPPQRRALEILLAELWPEAERCASCADGIEAQEELARLRPDVAFLDLRMPGQGGLEVARAAGQWCQVVFVTAYDDAAIAAFERGAVDYLLKPVTRERLAMTLARVRARAAWAPTAGGAAIAELEHLVAELRQRGRAGAQPLRWITATVRDTVTLYGIEQVLAFQSQDKYTRVLTATDDAIIRTSLKELQPRLDPEEFWHVHRSAIVRASAIEKVVRDELGKHWLLLRGRGERLPVSSAFHSRLRGM